MYEHDTKSGWRNLCSWHSYCNSIKFIVKVLEAFNVCLWDFLRTVCNVWLLTKKGRHFIAAVMMHCFQATWALTTACLISSSVLNYFKTSWTHSLSCSVWVCEGLNPIFSSLTSLLSYEATSLISPLVFKPTVGLLFWAQCCHVSVFSYSWRVPPMYRFCRWLLLLSCFSHLVSVTLHLLSEVKLPFLSLLPCLWCHAFESFELSPNRSA